MVYLVIVWRTTSSRRVYVVFWAVADGLAIWSGAWLEKDWKIGAKEVWLKEMWMDIWEWTQSVKIFLSQVSTHQKAAIMEGVLSNLVNKITWPVDEPGFDWHQTLMGTCTK